MRDTGLYSRILGLSDPRFVADVELDTAGGRADVYVEYADNIRWRCPTCGRELACRDHAEPRVWHHLDTCQFKIFLHARVPRVECPEHGVLQVKVPWVEAKIRAVAMDMWEPYFKATIKHVPDAAHKIVHDRFHIMQHVGQAVDKVRRQEHRELLRQEDERLKGTRYIWLYREENLPDKHRPILEALKDTNLKVAKAWAMKESLSGLWNYLSVGWAKRFMKRWLTWVRKSDLTPMREVGEMLSRHLDNILTFCRHRITNGAAGGLNSKIMAIKCRACGYRNREHFKTAIYFFCGNLDLYPKQA